MYNVFLLRESNHYLQDNMIDEEKAKREAAAQLTMEEKIVLLDQQVDALSTR